jgi:GDP-D-mannose 3',5'-epimerase
MKTALICGAGGFIGGHLVDALKRDGFWVRGADLKLPRHEAQADDFVIADLRDPINCRKIIDRPFDEVYQLAADMGGAGYVFTSLHDAEIMRNSATMNLNLLEAARYRNVKRIFYSSSACVYPEQTECDPEAPATREDSAYPANPDSEYGWEKLFSERLYLAYQRNFGMEVRIARYHNIFGPFGAWDDGREKVPAAICRKVAEAARDGAIEIWGDGEQTRSFLYVDECVKATLALMRSDFSGPVNIGSEEMVSINRLAEMVMEVAAKPLEVLHVPGPQGVRGRNSNNDLFEAKLGWRPSMCLMDGLRKTYPWIAAQVRSKEEQELRMRARQA